MSDLVCTGDRLCLDGWCRNALGFVPPLVDDPQALASYLENRIRFLFGPYLNRELTLDAALAETVVMGNATSRWRFWNGFATAVHRLRDSHSFTYPLGSYLITDNRPLNACFTPGDGDISHAIVPADPHWPDVLVSHVGSDGSWGLHPGDRIVAVDGQHPRARLLTASPPSPDPARTYSRSA